jgi:hypothetical protein
MNLSTLFENAVEFFLNLSCHDWSECLSAMGYCAAEAACEGSAVSLVWTETPLVESSGKSVGHTH